MKKLIYFSRCNTGILTLKIELNIIYTYLLCARIFNNTLEKPIVAIHYINGNKGSHHPQLNKLNIFMWLASSVLEEY